MNYIKINTYYGQMPRKLAHASWVIRVNSDCLSLLIFVNQGRVRRQGPRRHRHEL